MKTKKLFKIRFFLRKIIHFKNHKFLNQILADYETLIDKFNVSPKYYNDMLCKKYGSTSFSFAYSNACFKRDLEIITNKYKNILVNDEILFNQDDLKITLSSNPKVISEGIFTLHLFYKNTLLYSLSFVLLEDALLISAMQGAFSAKDEIKDFTKAFFGLRPINFIIYCAFVFANSIGFNKVCGIKDKYLVSRFKRNRKRDGRVFVIPNYDEIWQENTNIINAHHSFYELSYIQKDLEEIPSKKRSMYKKRYEFLKSVVL